MSAEEIIDLSQDLNPGITVYPDSAGPVINTLATIEQEGYREKQLIISTHHGTHIDCPYHLLKDGLNIRDAPLSAFYGKGLVIDCRKTLSPLVIDMEHLNFHESRIAQTDFLLLLTGMNKYWNTSLYTDKFPVLSAEAADYLAKFRLKGIGLDALSIDPVGDSILYNHKKLLAGNIMIIENLTGLEQLLNKRFFFCCFPLKIEDGDGSPVRACAIL